MTEVSEPSTPKPINPEDVEDVSKLSQIQNKYTFWFRGGSGGNNKAQIIDYTQSVKKISSFQTVEHFWRIYDHLKRPNDFRVTTEYHLFKEGITPTWEDPQNKLGGKWMVRLKKGISSRYWEDVVLAVIGEQFDVGPEICGAVISVRNSEDIISVWNKTADNAEAVTKIRDQLRRIWKLPAVISIEYKRHQDSLVDKSSYRNPSVVWRAPSLANKPNAGGEGGKPPGYAPYNKSYNTNNNHNGEQGNRGPAAPYRQNYQERTPRERDNSHQQQEQGQSIPRAAWKPNRSQEDSEKPTADKQSHVEKPALAWGRKAAV